MAQQLYKNNANSTLPGSITNSQTNIAVQPGDGAKFSSPTGTQYFLVTLDSGGGVVEICICTSRTGDTLTVVRAQEGTTGSAFAPGALVEQRVTASTLGAFSRYQDVMYELAGVSNLLAPNVSDGNSYFTHDNDDYGNPILVLKNDNYSWRFPSHNIPVVSNVAITGATTTTVTSTSISNLIEVSPASGKYIIQFRGTTANLAGTARLITAAGVNTVTFSPALSVTPTAGTDRIDIFQSNASKVFSASTAAAGSGFVYGIMFS